MIGDYREATSTAEMAHRVLALALFAMEDYLGAIDNLKIVTDLNPLDYMAYVYIGRCFACMEEWEESIEGTDILAAPVIPD